MPQKKASGPFRYSAIEVRGGKKTFAVMDIDSLVVALCFESESNAKLLSAAHEALTMLQWYASQCGSEYPAAYKEAMRIIEKSEINHE